MLIRGHTEIVEVPYRTSSYGEGRVLRRAHERPVDGFRWWGIDWLWSRYSGARTADEPFCRAQGEGCKRQGEMRPTGEPGEREGDVGVTRARGNVTAASSSCPRVRWLLNLFTKISAPRRTPLAASLPAISLGLASVSKGCRLLHSTVKFAPSMVRLSASFQRAAHLIEDPNVRCVQRHLTQARTSLPF